MCYPDVGGMFDVRVGSESTQKRKLYSILIINNELVQKRDDHCL